MLMADDDEDDLFLVREAFGAMPHTREINRERKKFPLKM